MFCYLQGMSTSPETKHFDEMYSAVGDVRDIYQPYASWLSHLPDGTFERKSHEAELLFRRLGITFAVYGESSGSERLIPFDIVPRIFGAKEWRRLEQGIKQRVKALNAFLHDIYHDQEIIKAGVINEQQVLNNAQFRKEMQGIDLPNQVYAHIAGIDLVRVAENDFYVLEDNLRTPSGVSYMLENRNTMMRLFPELFASHTVEPVEHYPQMLLDTLREAAPLQESDPTIVVMTPGAYNSAYFEHAFLASQMGVELVEGQDLFVRQNKVYMYTTEGPQQVHVIYRRVDDDFLDPLAFRRDSCLGVPGLFEAYRSGNVSLANGVGTGVADDKSTYLYVPEMIRFYLGEAPILSNVPTWRLSEDEDLKYVLAHLSELVVKEVQGSGGYGMLVGPTSSKEEIETYRQRIIAEPSQFIAQPTLALSTCPTMVDAGVAPRHVDLRPFVLSGKEIRLVPGGLTRVALREGSLVVNSSQGGGTKDTWVLED
ncbi:MAG: circularly permuted type 2 ATP-grasp protein [Gammaproteobacteria bacterium]